MGCDQSLGVANGHEIKQMEKRLMLNFVTGYTNCILLGCWLTLAYDNKYLSKRMSVVNLSYSSILVRVFCKYIKFQGD